MGAGARRAFCRRRGEAVLLPLPSNQHVRLPVRARPDSGFAGGPLQLLPGDRGYPASRV
jgi:hypothetical protein